MKIALSLSVAVLLLASANFMTGQDKSPAPQDRKSGLKIALVNLRDCFDQTKVGKVKDLESELDKTQAGYNDELNKRKQDIQKIRDQMAGVPQETKLYQELRGQIALAVAQLEAKKKLAEVEIKERQRAFRLDIYNDIVSAIKNVSEERSIDLVLKIDAPSSPDEDDERSSIEMRILYRQVLYFKDTEDINITAKVVEKMNAEYAKTKVNK